MYSGYMARFPLKAKNSLEREVEKIVRYNFGPPTILEREPGPLQ
jgi:hypothetical protein